MYAIADSAWYIYIYIISYMQLPKVTTTEALRELMGSEDYNFRYSCGVAQPAQSMELKDCERLVASFAMHYSIMYCMAELI